ncbi:MAG TPA: hypothetical protein VL308_16750 [Gemmatimonadaceae bacterium]|jgi:hypothetical protein|nr:hypothetical protein [Gemmatimonadaceae bacterium]
MTTIELPARPMTARDVVALKARRSELSNQLESATSRRNSLAAKLDDAEGVNKTGIEQRISLLDNRILQLETDLAETGRQLSGAPAGLLASASVGTPLGLNSGQITAIGIVSVVGAASVAFPIAVAMARRIWRGASRRDAAPVAPQSAERMERLEQAVDAIAIEIERVSEGQRYVTRLLTEGSAPALPVGQRAAEPVLPSDREPVRASRERA